MIRSFKHKGLEAFFRSGSKAGIVPSHASKLRRLLLQLDHARSAQDMNVVGWRWHALRGDLAGHWSVWVNGNWRLTFAFDDGQPVLVDYQDYHRPEDFTMARMFDPPHPGETLREDVLPALGLSVTDAALELGVTRAALSRVLNGRAGISPEMALRLERWLGVENGGRAEVWIGMQASYDLWRAEQSSKATLRKIKPVASGRLAAAGMPAGQLPA